MTKNVSFDYSKAASYISEEVLANMKKILPAGLIFR